MSDLVCEVKSKHRRLAQIIIGILRKLVQTQSHTTNPVFFSVFCEQKNLRRYYHETQTTNESPQTAANIFRQGSNTSGRQIPGKKKKLSKLEKIGHLVCQHSLNTCSQSKNTQITETYTTNSSRGEPRLNEVSEIKMFRGED